MRALFSPKRHWIDETGSECLAGGPLGPKEGVLLRSRSTYQRFDFSALAPARRRGALELAVRQAVPHAPGPFACRWQGGIAHVWMPSGATGVGEDVKLVSESSLVPPPAGNGARVLALREGFEGQLWEDGDLIVSRWWAHAPSAAAWGVFLRSAGSAASSAGGLDEPVTLPLSREPWGARHETFDWSPAQLETFGWRAVVVFAALVVGWQVAATAAWGMAEWLQTNRLESLREESAPLIEARERAEASQQRMAALVALVDAPSDVRLLADVRRALGAEVRLLGWSRDDVRLRIEVQGAGDDPRPIVRAFEAHPLLSRIVANPLGEGRMQLDIDLQTAESEVR